MTRWMLGLGIATLVACGGAGDQDLFNGSGSGQGTTPQGDTPPSSSGTTTPPGTPPPVTPPPTGNPPPPPGCTNPTTYYRDKDGDGVGGTNKVTACVSPGKDWVTTTGDCDDDDADVHPGQTAYFNAPYTRPTGGQSYDYDCSNTEDQAPPGRHLAGTCTLNVTATGCTGDGFIPQGPRTGTGVDPLCGPVQKQTCSLKTTGQPGCFATVTTAEPTTCH